MFFTPTNSHNLHKYKHCAGEAWLVTIRRSAVLGVGQLALNDFIVPADQYLRLVLLDVLQQSWGPA